MEPIDLPSPITDLISPAATPALIEDESEDENEDDLPDYTHLITPEMEEKIESTRIHYQMKRTQFEDLLLPMITTMQDEIDRKTRETRHEPSSIYDHMATLLNVKLEFLHVYNWGTLLQHQPLPNDTNEKLLLAESVRFKSLLIDEYLWKSGGRYTYYLTDTERRIVENSSEWLTNDAITWAMFDLQKQFPCITGFLPMSAFETNTVNLALSDYGIFAQIINIGNHFVTICGYFSPTAIVLNIYDSLNIAFQFNDFTVQHFLLKSVSDCFRNHMTDKIEFTFCEVDKQTDGNCGFNAIAMLVAFLHAFDPCSIKFVSNLRKHFKNCFNEIGLTPFDHVPCATRSRKTVTVQKI